MATQTSLPASNNSLDRDTLIGIMNVEKSRLLVPFIVYIAVLMVSGLIGNATVCIYYGCKTKRTTSSIFIVTLAVYDIIVCLFGMPTEIVDVVKFYTFENDSACKILRFLNYFATVGSVFTLIVIATDRFKKLCKPTGKQIQLKHVKYITTGVSLFSLGCTWPSFLIYESVQVNIPNDYNVELRGFDCTFSKRKENRPYVWVFNLLSFTIFVVCIIVLIVLYSVISKSLYHHSKRLSKLRKISRDPETTMSSINMDDMESQMETHHKSISEKTSTQGKQAISVDTESVRIAFIMIAVTVLFIASFLPYFSLVLWRLSKGKHETELLSDAGLVGFYIGSRSFLLSSSLNPYIYGVFNRAFRGYFLQILCCNRR